MSNTNRHIIATSMECPECKGKGCNFCNGSGKIYYYPSPDAHDYIKIARAKYRIKQRNK